MTINVYQKGNLMRISTVFSNAEGVATNPTTVEFSYAKPSGVITTLVYGVDAALVRDSTGNYHVDLSLSDAGEWYYQWQSTGVIEAAHEGQFTVPSSEL